MKRAFTLIELLVVIAIIAILAGIALPVFTRVQERGRVTEDANSLRQLGLAIAAYFGDNDDQFFSAAGGGAGETTTSWPLSLYDRYVQTTKVFHSPFDKRVRSETSGFPVSYGTNPNAMNKNASSFKSPSQLILIAPNLTGAPDVAASWAGTADNDPKLTIPASATDFKGTHGNRRQINALFGDFHVESMTWQKFADTSSEEGKKRWEPEAESTPAP
jgi:prepilin-type N-terminal cleavage/methylation domain-containing protein/prepilin-type processing-associated H-X9-DG protein